MHHLLHSSLYLTIYKIHLNPTPPGTQTQANVPSEWQNECATSNYVPEENQTFCHHILQLQKCLILLGIQIASVIYLHSTVLHSWKYTQQPWDYQKACGEFRVPLLDVNNFPTSYTYQLLTCIVGNTRIFKLQKITLINQIQNASFYKMSYKSEKVYGQQIRSYYLQSPEQMSCDLRSDITRTTLYEVHPITCHEGTEGELKYTSTLPLTSMLHGGGWLTPQPRCSTLARHLVPIIQDAWWVPCPVWMGAENLT